MLETLEARQLLAGPELIGVQPNEGELLDNGAVRQIAPRVLTFRFDQDQQLDANTLDSIQLTRSGRDGLFGTTDDVRITPGLVSLGDPNENEVVVRFADSLPDDNYRITIYGYDDPNATPVPIVGLRNVQGELIQPSVVGERVETVNFRLDLGALIEAVVPQPVIRNADGSLTQNRDEIVVYFNEDPLFVEDDAAGNPTERSAENPRFYQLLLTQDSVRTTDDEFYLPEEVIYDATTHTARLIFESDINNLPGVPVGGGTFRLRIGTAVDSKLDLIVEPSEMLTAPTATVSLGVNSGSFEFVSRQVGENASGQQVRFVNTGTAGLSVSQDTSGVIVVNYGGSTPLVSDLVAAVEGDAIISSLISISVNSSFLSTQLPQRLVGGDPITLVGLGDTLSTSLDIGTFDADTLTSLVIRESISPQQVNIELPGGDDDPGHRLLIEHINDAFGADLQSGITEIPYNFKGVYFQNGTTSSLNQITPTQKLRIREVLQLWSNKIGVQFTETADQGITFALGETSDLLTAASLPDDLRFTAVPQLQASVRVDPAINDNATAGSSNASIVFSNQANFGFDYGEDFTRKAAAGVGLLLGLLAAPDQAPRVLMALNAFNDEALLRRPTDGVLGPAITAPTTDPNSPDYQRFAEEHPEFRGFLNDLIDPITLPADVPTTEGSLVYLPDNLDDFSLPDWEPVFPSNVDVLHGQYVHRPDSVDVDLYRFVIDLDDANRIGQLSVETFAERLSDSSALDTTVTLFEEVRASASTDLKIGPSLQLRVEATQVGTGGNGARIEFIESDRDAGDDQVRVLRLDDGAGGFVNNAILIDMPRRGRFVDAVEVGQLIAAIENDAFASSLFQLELVKGSITTDISGLNLRTTPIILSGGGLHQLSRNDDYFSEDSFLTASLGEGVYYIGVAASGNDTYDPMVKDSGFGGLTQGDYELRIKFEPQVDEVDVIRDRDGTRPGVPGTPIDGDGDGVPRGANNFWFQTRPELRTMQFTLGGESITPGQTMTITGANGDTRTYEFLPFGGGSARPGNVVVRYSSTPGNDSPPENLAELLATAINGRQDATGVVATVNADSITLDGERSVSFSNSFRGVESFGRMIFVDKLAATNADGSIDLPFNNINNPAVVNAFDSTLRGDIVRIVGNGGSDQNIVTEADNFAYEFGLSEVGGRTLEDGRDMEIPAGVTTMIDAGAIFKLRSSRISVGSSSTQIDRSGGALQVLGTPRLVSFTDTGASLIGEVNDAGLGYDDGSVIFTSTRDRAADAAGAGTSIAPKPGDWGGIVFRRDIDQALGRLDLEDEGIFLHTVNHAEIRYGGSSDIRVDSVQQLVNPIQLINLRPNISFNEITRSADAAMSAAPDSFQETTFSTPAFQQAGSFTPDYSRVGPDIHNNVLTNNSLNGLFIRTVVTPNSAPTQLMSSARFDDTSVVHFIAENLVIAGDPGGAIQDGIRPSLAQASAQILTGGAIPNGTSTVEYLMTFVDGNGFESAATDVSAALRLSAATGETLAGASIQLAGLPRIPDGTDYVSRRLYRAEFDATGALISGGYHLIASLDGLSSTYTDGGASSEGLLDLNRVGRRGRLDASLVIDPGMVVKLQGARIELGHGTQLLAEGTLSQPVIFTSSLDDRYGTGGTFDTNNDANTLNGNEIAERGDWSGIYAGANAYVSLDHSVVSYAGGISLVTGGESRGFAPLELQQADGRITNTRFEFNEDGQDGSGRPGRGGRLAVDPSVIFVRGSQPVIVANEFKDNRGAAIGIDVDSMVADLLRDTGRQTGSVDTFSEFDDNHGPLVRLNRFEVVPADDDEDKQISGLVIRGGELLVESIWDDTDIVHVLNKSVTVGNIQSSGGLRLQSRANESLVVKLSGAGTPNSATLGTGFTATGETSDSDQRLGGTIHIVGLPGAPVVLTSFKDDTVGAGLAIDGTHFTDTNGDSYGSRPETNDWRSVLLDQYSNDRNVDFILEEELTTDVAPGRNGDVNQAQFLGDLAADLNLGDENRRLGFEVSGYLSGPTDVDTYSFDGSAGSEVWFDIDSTSFGLDTVVELLNAEGVLLARSDNSIAGDVVISDPSVAGLVSPLQSRADTYTEKNVFGDYLDIGSINSRDAGFRVVLPGDSTGNDSRSTYYFRVRSASTNPNDPNAGGSHGTYLVQVRLQEAQEYPGSVIRYTDIRWANNGIHVRGLPGESPLMGEAGENESVVGDDSPFGIASSNDVLESVSLQNDNRAPAQQPQNVGNLLDGKRPVISVAGSISDGLDVDFYQVDIAALVGTEGLNTNYMSTIFDVDYASGLTRPDTNISVFYDPDGEFGPALPQLVLFGADSNVAEDQSSPFGENGNFAERLDRGSISASDPLIGPVSLPEGAYYVAITAGERLPEQLSDVAVRREPINSIQRIFEDRIDSAATGDSVFGGPREDELFSDAAIIGGGFTTTTERANDIGHGVNDNFDKTNFGLTGRNQTFYSEFRGEFNTTDDTNVESPYTRIQRITEGTAGPAGALDLNTLDWSISSNPQIGGTDDFTAQTIPHVSIEASMNGDSADFYQLTITENNTRVIIDVDEGENPFQSIFGDPTLGSVDVDLVILDASRVLLNPPGRVFNSLTTEGQTGSAGDTFFSISSDPFFDGILDQGVYFIGILEANTQIVTAPNGTLTFPRTGEAATGRYVMHVSAADQVIGDGANESIHFDRNVETRGQLLSNAFDLVGYAAEDLPRFYFNYLWDSPLDGLGNPIDSLTLKITSAENPAGITFDETQPNLTLDPTADPDPDFISDSQWRQKVISLSDFAGHTDIRFEFEYESDGVVVDEAEGLYLDDFIVGFAERGETVFNSTPGATTFVGEAEGPTGEYQLEMRRATSFTTPTGNAQGLTRSFDTNDRHAQEITLVVPAGSQVQDGDIFEINDGKTTQVFEFDNNGSTRFTNQRLIFSTADTPAELAMRIRTAINATNRLDVEAASASGLDDETMTGNRLNLFGAVNGSFTELASYSDAPQVTDTLDFELTAQGNRRILMPAVLHNGSGDVNYTRTQGQVIIENNVISDVHAIGIYSEAGDRGTDMEYYRGDPSEVDFFNELFGIAQSTDSPHPFLQLPPVGNPAAGVARNLPTLNNSVDGGLMSGVVIRNNTIDQARMSGIKVEGETRPFVIDALSLNVNDGYTMAIDAAGTRVVFEFEDIGGAPVVAGGSGTAGGNGFIDGHVPIYYRHQSSAAAYNNAPGTVYPYSSFELMLAIEQAIQGSILVTNDMAEVVTAYLGPSMVQRSGFEEQFAANPESFPNAAVYLQGVSNIYFTTAYGSSGGGITDFSVGPAPVAEAAQPFARVVNNTVYGSDGTQSLFPDDAKLDNNDVLADATTTYVGRDHAGPYIQNAAIGYNIPQGLTDQTITFRTVFDSSNVTDARSAVVGVGVEFGNIANFATDGAPTTTVNANIDVNNASISVNYTGSGVVADGSFNGYVFEGDFSNLRGVDVSDASTVGVDVSFTDTQLLVNLTGGQTIDASDQLFLSLEFPTQEFPAALAGVEDANDVDLYKVELIVGDRLIVDIDTIENGPDTIIRIFDEFGESQVLNFGAPNETKVADNGAAPDYLDPRSTAFAGAGRAGTVTDNLNGRDPFVDFTALKTGTYFIGVSSVGNAGYDPNSLSGRTGGTTTGDYEIGIEVYTPRQFVMSLDDGNEGQSRRGGTVGSDLVGTTFTVTQIADFAGNWPNFPVSGGTPTTVGNQLTFEFTNSVTGIVLGNGNYNVPLIANYNVPEIMDAIASAVTGLQDPISGADIPALPNNENGNGPGGRSGPIARGRATALGGQSGDNLGIVNLSDPSRRPGQTRTLFPIQSQGNDTDFPLGFGHDRVENNSSTLSPNNTLTDGFASTELYVLFENIAEIELSPQAMAAGLKLSTNDFRPNSDNNNRVEFAENADQLIAESGIWVTGGASPTLLNNVLSNLHQSILVDETNFFGFGKRVRVAGNDFIKPQEVVVNGNVFQHDESRNSEIRFDVTWPVDPTGPFDIVDTSLSTDDVVGATNVTLQSGDFNFFIDPTGVLLVDSQGNNFLPAPGSRVIDSATSSLNERSSFSSVKTAVGLPISNVLAPNRDVNGVLRADNPNFVTSGGSGQSIFKDRGSSELADFIGPIAIALNPRDNDAAGLDRDTSVSYIQRGVGVLGDFRIQLVDTGDGSNPFTGIGIDDSTLKVAEIPGLRREGANLTVFENDELLEEGIDYTFRYDETSNTITLIPLAGVWRDDRSYRIALNNRDRTVLIAPDPSEVTDGDQIRITDSDGGTVVFEFDSGYQLFLPETPTLIVPTVGTEVGGLSDGDIFLISDGINDAVVFEFDNDGVLLPGSRRVSLPTESLVGQQVGLRVGNDNFLFQFVEENGSATGGAIAVTFNPADPVEGSIFELYRVIQQTLANNGINVVVDVADDDLTTLIITTATSGPAVSITSKPTSFSTGAAPSPSRGISLQLESLPAKETPTGRQERQEYLNLIAQSIQTAITQERRKTNETGDLPSNRAAAFDFEVKIDANRVVLGAPAGYVVDTSGTGLGQDARTLALQVPTVGTGINGIVDGDSFTVSNGNSEKVFEFTLDAQLDNSDATQIFLDTTLGNLTGGEIAELIRETVEEAGLGLTPTVDGETVYLDLPANGLVAASSGQLRVLGLSRPLLDGDIIRVAKAPEPPSTAIAINNAFPAGFEVGTIVAQIDSTVFTLELREGDLLPELYNFEFDTSDADPAEVTPGNFPIDVTETIADENGVLREYFVSRDELARRIAQAIQARGIDVSPVAQDEFIYLTVPAEKTARIISEFNGIGLTETATFEERVTFEFDLSTAENPNGDGVTPGNRAILYSLTDTSSELADKVTAALNPVDDAGNAITLIDGLLPGSSPVAPGQVAVNVSSDNPLTLSVTIDSSLEIRGEPGVSGSSTVEVFGPLLLSMPVLGGNSITNGGIFVIADDDGNDIVFQFGIGGFVPPAQAVVGANVVNYSTADDPDVLATKFAAAIRAAATGLTATVVNGTQVSLGRTDQDRVSNAGLPGVSGTPAIDIVRGIVSDGEILRIRQGDVSVSFEFDSVDNGGGVEPGNVQVAFQPTSTPGDIAEALAAAIRNNSGGLRFTPGEDGTVYPIAELDENGIPTGGVILNDLPGTQVDISDAPTLNVTGVPGGAIPIAISPLFSPEAVKQVMLRQLNSVNVVGELPTTTLVAEDRGGNTLFVENASIISGPVSNYYLPAIKDVVGNPLQPNRDDRTTQFTINLSDIALDFGDAPDPVGLVAGRYPTRLADNGARHIIGVGPVLGTSVDAEVDALSVRTADGDDFTISVSGGGSLFVPRLEDGVVKIDINPNNLFDVTRFDGETFTIDTGAAIATFEFDTDGIFDEDNYNIWVPGYTGNRILTAADSALLTRTAIATGIEEAIALSPLNPASTRTVEGATPGSVTFEVSGDDEDGVTFTSTANPEGLFNASLTTQVSVTVTGAGILEGWIDFNADGDWDDPGELVISPDLAFDGTVNPAIFGEGTTTHTFPVTIPATTTKLLAGQSANTYARFRVSTNGTGSPVGLALSGEVEDYLVRLVGGQPPAIGNPSPQYTVREGDFLQAGDDTGTDAFTNNNGLLVGVTTATPGGVQIYADDIGVRQLFDESGQFAGTLEVQRNGTFTFDADDDFSGQVTFSVLATDVVPSAPQNQLVSPTPIVATITVTPVNDRPTLQDGVVEDDVVTTTTINEDNVVSQADQTSLGPVVFTASQLIDPFYSAGPGTEPDEQDLFFLSAGTVTTPFRTTQGGSLTISSNGRTILYTPPQDYNGLTADTFTYTVADRLKSTLPGTIVSQTADVSGRVEITINAINDNPRVNNETYQTTERVSNSDPILIIPINGPTVINGQSVAGILDNDTAGPLDETQPPQNQTISLKAGQFTSIENGAIVQSRRTEGGGGRIALVGNNLEYTPRLNFSGIDRFTYIVVDSLGAESTATAFINVGGVNNQPEFFGVRGQEGQTTLEFDERKAADETATFDLTSWFVDADDDSLTFPQPTVENTDLFTATTNGSQLTLNFKPFAFGTTTLFVRATDSLSPDVVQEITVTVLGSDDPPVVAGSLQPLQILEDGVGQANLRRPTVDGDGLFFDPDNDVLTYRVRRLGSISNPTAAQIAAHPLVQSIQFLGDTLQITPKPDQSGSVQIEIEASDGTFVNSHSFDFVVLATEDAPRGNVTPSGVASPDAYSVPVGGTLRITDPSLGLLRNDFDPDPGSSIRIAPGSLTQPVGGTGAVDLLGREDGAFSFTTTKTGNSIPVAGQTDTFTYRLIDNTGRLSGPITVNITFNQSSYQNPINKFDVSADGFITAVDALRILNLMNARGADTSAFSVSELTSSPPDYYDVNGDGFISSVDVLQVIEELNRRDANGNNGSSEPLATQSASSVTTVTSNVAGGIESSLASTQAFASGSTANLGSANTVLRTAEEEGPIDASASLDKLLTFGMDLQSGGQLKAEEVADTLASNLSSSQASESETTGQANDSALLDLFSDSFETD
ncbi:dockerin type I domain-containing protein [Aporhodopirellula aestuarii]|uniref:Dockerin type I domain-containing protein n=1 Tax=Aporhodopirellula aestuarii TaxID=2950107 RepID=A0ABT0UCJ8_9BACT|nr:Ig-like domain-containing protein [Aporhodopirellula aestuarii]MCM2374200.1 dockerin type I domain-containing protein [Aporhodopirellula aestuarii]